MCALTIKQNLKQSDNLVGVSDTARLDTEILLAFVLDADRTHLYTWPENTLTADQQNQFDRLLERRSQGEPIAYIIGRQEFWSLNLRVSPSTLIPRPETELLVEKVLGLLPANEPYQLLDLGTGTGAIALALASERPRWNIVAVDTDKTICELAENNRRYYELDNVQVIRSDWFQQLGQQEFDLIVSNPPYIDAGDPHLDQGDVRFEPRSALVADNQGLADIEAIISQSISYLSIGAYLIFEHGYQQAPEVTALLSQYGFVEIFTANDLAGQPRVTGAKWESHDHDE